MTLMSRKVDYALLILNYLDDKDQGAAAREIAEHFELSKGFVANILKELCGQSFVESHRGVNGGYVLTRDLEQVSLVELMDALDADVSLTECTKENEKDGCSVSSRCAMRGGIADLHQRIRSVLGAVTIAELFRSPTEGRTQYGLELGSTNRPFMAN